jgi:transposase
MLAEQIAKLNGMIAETMQGHQQVVLRLAEVPGFGADSAQQVIADVGAQASTFPSPANLTSWVGTCPGKQESAEQNHSSRCAKGSRHMRRILNQAARAAVEEKGSHFQSVFRRLLPRLGYKAAIGAIAHRLCRLVWKILHEGVSFLEKGSEPDPRRKHHRALKLLRILRRLGYEVDIKPAAPNRAAATRCFSTVRSRRELGYYAGRPSGSAYTNCKPPRRL